jgi:mRNA deadenylase 3'-5' endonuclease subunit Ccr4
MSNSRRNMSSTNTSTDTSTDANSSSDNSLSLPWVQSLSTSNIPFDTSTITSTSSSNISNKKQTSIFSWNILAQHLFDSTQHWYKYVSPNDPVHKWSDRWPVIKDEIQSSDGDIICLQEVEFTVFDEDILPSMQSLGYDGIAQNSKSRSRGHSYGVATFWKKDRFQLRDAMHRSRTMITTLEDIGNVQISSLSTDTNTDTNINTDNNKRDANNEIVAILNCHLEGNPNKSVTRVKQLQSALKTLKNKYSHHQVIICGDFNCKLGESACSTFLHHGSCPKDVPIVEWGRKLPQQQKDELVKIKKHGYNLHSAYPMDLMTKNPSEYITFVNEPRQFSVGLDQIWYHSNNPSPSPSSSTVVGLRHPFHSPEHRNQVIKNGLPSRFHPSDHMPIGCILEWDVSSENNYKDLCRLHEEPYHLESIKLLLRTEKSKEDKKDRTVEDALNEMAELFNACPFASEEHRLEAEFVISPVEGLPTPRGVKPSDEQILQVKKRRTMKKKLWEEVSTDVRQMIERCIVLQKEATTIQSRYSW